MEKLVNYEKKENIGKIIINNPKMDLETIKGLINALQKSIENNDQCVILTCSGKNFAFGEDLEHAYELMTNPEMQSQALEVVWSFQEVTSLMMEHRGIIIAGYRGWVIGGGFELTLFCDLRIAADDTKIWLPELDVGMFFSNASTKMLAWLIGGSRAKELMLLGKQINATEALQYGIVNQICKPEELNETLTKIANQIALKSPISLRYAKELINSSSENTIHGTLFKEFRYMMETGKSDEAKTRIEAFLKKQKKKRD